MLNNRPIILYHCRSNTREKLKISNLASPMNSDIIIPHKVNRKKKEEKQTIWSKKKNQDVSFNRFETINFSSYDCVKVLTLFALFSFFLNSQGFPSTKRIPFGGICMADKTHIIAVCIYCRRSWTTLTLFQLDTVCVFWLNTCHEKC